MFKQKGDGKPKKDERIIAKNELLAILRAHDEVSRTLGVTKTADDRTYLKALSKFSSSFDILRSAGCTIAEAAKAADLLELALQAPVKKEKKSTVSRAEQAGKAIAGCLVFVLLILGFVIVWNLTQATAGWSVAKCSLQLYQNQTCEQGPGDCLFEVMVRGEDSEWVTIKRWPLPIAYSTGLGGISITRFYGDMFRCCNTGEGGTVGECCDLYDHTSQAFCDNFGGVQTDAEGKACPLNPWPCLYQLDEANPIYAKAVKPFEPVDIMPMLIPVFMIVGVLMCGLFALLLRRLQCSCGICSRALTKLMKLIDDDEDDYPPSPTSGGPKEEEPSSPKSAEVVSPTGGSAKRASRLDGAASVANLLQGRRSSAVGAEDSTRRGSAGSIAANFGGLSMPQDGRRSSVAVDETRSSDSSSTASAQQGKRGSLASRGSVSGIPALGLPGVPEPEEWQDEVASEAEESMPDPKKFMSWGSLDKDAKDLDENDLHQCFKTGDLTKLTRKAEGEMHELFAPVVEPLEHLRQSPYTATSGRTQRPGTVGAAGWAWAGKDFEGQHVLDVRGASSSGHRHQGFKADRRASRSDGFLQAPKQQGRRQPSSRPSAARSSRVQPSSRAWTAPGS